MPSVLSVGDIAAALSQRLFPGGHHLEPPGGAPAQSDLRPARSARRSAMRSGC